jgi:hypothetical protein
MRGALIYAVDRSIEIHGGSASITACLVMIALLRVWLAWLGLGGLALRCMSREWGELLRTTWSVAELRSVRKASDFLRDSRSNRKDHFVDGRLVAKNVDLELISFYW